ncbi:LacI family DNA-binding transcriptional regulator [Ectobacillus panaciterrae]|uniref:LacI family DNA-binding transcriptional regulator n=1 Tax=Ectobacillus panaciterrae TaxID=363872 RepID=UPI0003F6F81B|nr:LacI family DNA-binding transcriptional regulator [Ectobacillus panaciterrae]
MIKTISDIAKIAGVAKSTVSRYLNGGSVSDVTKRKIEHAIKETGYIPNTFAQSLKAKKTNIIGTIVPRLDSYAASRTLIGIDEELRGLNYQMLISNANQNLEREIENIYTLASQKIAGLILLATQITDEHLEAFGKINIPVLLVGQQHKDVYSLIHDDYGAAYDMGKYVLKKGHRRIAYLGVTEKDIAVGVKRKEGFKRAVQEADNCEVKYYETEFNIENAIIKAAEVIDEFQPSVLVCATDNIALGALKAAYVKGLHVPEDISITGFGGYEVNEVIHPALTTAKFYYKEAGQAAAQDIVKLVNEEEVAKITISKYEIIERESVDNR